MRIYICWNCGSTGVAQAPMTPNDIHNIPGKGRAVMACAVAVAPFVGVKGVIDEGLSYVTGGWSDFISLKGMVKKDFLRNSKALILQNKRSISKGRGARWGATEKRQGLTVKPRIEGLYIQGSKKNGLNLYNYRNKSGKIISRVEKGVGFDGGKAFWHYHSRPGIKHHRPIFPWSKGRK